jgi:hypothetical protein
MPDSKKIKFIPSGRGKAQCPPNPAYPSGIHVGAAEGTTESCFVKLPYPAPECGWFEVECLRCQRVVVITAAGRPDDPVSFEMPCGKRVNA